MEQQLANIKLRFFTDISHELRTPLTLISSPVTEVLENEPLSPSAREHLTLVHQNTERMLRLMNQILDFRKIQNQKMKLLIEETDLIPLLQKVMSSFKLIAEEKNINYQLTSTIQSVYSWVDRDKFEKIFFNLLSNAFKYTPADKSNYSQYHNEREDGRDRGCRRRNRNCSRKATFLVPTLRVIGKTEYSATIFRHRAVSRERDGGNASWHYYSK